MHDENFFNTLDGTASIVLKERKIIKVNKQFTDITEYTRDELLNKNIEDVFRSLRVGPNVSIDSIDRQADYFLFTKSLEVKFINIEVVRKGAEGILILREKPNLRFDFLSQMSLENVCGVAIYSVPDNTLLKASQMYLDHLEEPYSIPENALGRSVGEIITGWAGSSTEAVWNNIIASGKSKHIKELKFYGFLRGLTYWDITFTPLCENKKVRYILVYSYEVTERVLYRKQLEEKNKIIEKQKRMLELFVENMADGLLLLDKNNKYTMLNKAAEDSFYNPENIINSGDIFAHTRYYDKDGNELNIDDMPSQKILKGEKVNQ
jgi:hypothetical protein